MPHPIEIRFFKVRAKFDRTAMKCILSSLPPDMVHVLIDRGSAVSELHIRSAFMHAARSVLAGRCRARDPSMEVLRYVAGSRQVGEGVSLAGPSEASTVIVMASAPRGWPSEGDGSSLPEVRHLGPEAIMADPSYLEPMEGPDHWGGREAAERVLSGEGSGPDPEMAVLEKVAMADLR
jgi:hypothetical protein